MFAVQSSQARESNHSVLGQGADVEGKGLNRLVSWILWPVRVVVGVAALLLLVALFMDDEGEYPRMT